MNNTGMEVRKEIALKILKDGWEIDTAAKYTSLSKTEIQEYFNQLKTEKEKKLLEIREAYKNDPRILRKQLKDLKDSLRSKLTNLEASEEVRQRIDNCNDMGVLSSIRNVFYDVDDPDLAAEVVEDFLKVLKE